MMRCAFDIVSACASVLATTKSTPCNPAVIMLLTALPPAPPTPNTVIRGFNSRMSGTLRLMVMGASQITRALVRPGRRPRELVKVDGLGERFIRSPHEAIVRLSRNSRQSLFSAAAYAAVRRVQGERIGGRPEARREPRTTRSSPRWAAG